MMMSHERDESRLENRHAGFTIAAGQCRKSKRKVNENNSKKGMIMIRKMPKPPPNDFINFTLERNDTRARRHYRKAEQFQTKDP